MRSYLQVLGYARPDLRLGGLALIGMLVYSLFSTATLLSAIPFLEILFHTDMGQAPPAPPESMGFSPSTAKAWAFYQLEMAIRAYGPLPMLLYFCVGLLGLNLLKNAARYLSGWAMAPLEQRILMRMRNDLFDHLSRLGLKFYASSRKGNLISTLTSDVEMIQEAVVSTVQILLREPILVIVILGTLFFLSWQLTLFVLLILPITGFFINLISGSLKRKAKEGQRQLGDLISVLDEFIAGMRIVKAFQREDFEREKYHRRNTTYTNLQIGIRRQIELASPITEWLSILVICGIMLFAGSLILSEGPGAPRKAEFIGFLVLFSQLLAPIKLISNGMAKIQKGMAAYQRVQELMAEPIDILDPAQPKPFPAFNRELRFEEVTFAYGTEEVLKGISFTLQKGKIVALVGPSGGGKSTIADLIPRFYDPVAGSIKVDGMDLREVSLKELRQKMAIVSQEGILFHDTILANIAYGDPSPDLEKVKQAANMAHADGFIEALPNGYDTVIGERGTMLSGGQRQRLSIARALLRNPDILILDEATSNLDTASEAFVQEALDRLMEGRTTLVIAHRLSTIRQADEILVVEAGAIVQRGTHETLLREGGLYQELYAAGQDPNRSGGSSDFSDK